MSDAEAPWRTALAHVHYLDADLLRRYFGTDLTAVASHPDVVLYRGAVWDAGSFRQRRRIRHRRLLAEVYCRLLPLALEWEGVAPGPAPVADALLWPRPRESAGADWPIYVEADTGRESGPQWQDKLAGYQRLERGRLWVIADGGPRRLAHLAAHIGAAHLPCAWALTALPLVDATLPTFHVSPPGGSADGEQTAWDSPATALFEYRTRSGEVVDGDTARRLLAEGSAIVRGRQRMHGRIVLVLDRGHGFRARVSWRKLQEFDRTPTK